MRVRFETLRVLLVEDDYEGRNLLRIMLHQIGITHIIETRGGNEALAYLDAHRGETDIILCDWNMPGMDGPTVLARVRDRGLSIPFLIITGRGDVASVTEARHFGIDAYIRKPFFPNLLEAKLRAVLHKVGATAA